MHGSTNTLGKLWTCFMVVDYEHGIEMVLHEAKGYTVEGDGS